MFRNVLDLRNEKSGANEKANHQFSKTGRDSSLDRYLRNQVYGSVES